MGYAHAWKRPVAIDGGLFLDIVRDFAAIVPELTVRGITLAGGRGEGLPEIGGDAICFNGAIPLQYETFDFPRVVPEAPAETWRLWDSCKTNRRPYDFAVMCVLVIAKAHLGADLEIESSAPDERWEQARAFCRQALRCRLRRSPRPARAPQPAPGLSV